jgi:UDP-glucose 4-epimerase
MKILISGGAGYIGSTIASILLDNGHQPVILDSLVNGRREFTDGRIFYQGDIADKELLKKIFAENPGIEATVHCAALILVPESEEKPAEYYRENVSKSVEFFESLKDLGCKKIIFSSSASVYGNADDLVVNEDSPLKPSSPYARTKMIMEMVLADFCRSYGIKGIALRYFNPIGTDPKMRTGVYNPKSTAVMRALLNAADGSSSEFVLTGTDWPTRDGSGIRDYLHIWDLAQAHLLALEKFDSVFREGKNFSAINIGTGNGVTVKELVSAFEKALGREIPKREASSRPGDVAGAYASRDLAKKLLGWEPELSVEQALSDALKWEGEKNKILK